MSDAGDRLARSRLAIIEQVRRKDRRHDGEREREREHARAQQRERGEPESGYGGEGRGISGWFGGLKHALGTWWRYHPAHMGVELATPILSAYAHRKPIQFLGIAAALGAVVVVVRPWRLITVGGLLAAVLKSSQLSGLLMSALSAADFQKDHSRPPYD
jgi:hypothetical protein